MAALPRPQPAATSPPSRCARGMVWRLACALSVLASASAQAQVAPAEPQVEIYVGVRRVDAGGQPRPQPSKSTEPATAANPQAAPPTSAAAVAVPSRIADPAPGAPAAAPPVHADIPLPPIASGPAAAPGSVVQASGVIGEAGGERLTPQERPPLPPPGVASSGAAPAPLPPNPVAADQAAPRDARETPNGSAPAGQPALHEADLAGIDSWLRVASAQFVGTLAAIAVALLLHLAGNLFLSRRRRPPEPPPIRIELVNPAPAPPAAVPAAKPEAALEPPPVPAAAEPRVEETVISEGEKAIGLGPSYDEERRAAEEDRQRAVDALLRQISDQNVQLRRRLAEEAAAAK
jgi:hypothetical protein